ncbi:MAG: N-acetylmuramoyl-L-alanine amidase family protein [Ignavibacteriales bacterium]
MKLTFFAFISAIFLFVSTSAQSEDDYSVHISSPSSRQGLLEFTGRPYYIYGTLTPAGSQLKVNGTPTLVDADGAFLAYAPLTILDEKNSQGANKARFVFSISGKNGQKEIEKIFWVKLPDKSSHIDHLYIDRNFQQEPSEDLTLQMGEAIEVEVKGTPGCKAYFNVGGIEGNIPMEETSRINSYYWGQDVFGDGYTTKGDTLYGIYKGHFILNQRLNNAKLTVTLAHASLGEIRDTLTGTVTTLNDQYHQIVSIKKDPNLVTGRVSPAGGYKLFLPEGVRLEVTGKKGEWLRTRLSGSESIYVPENSVNYLSNGASLPHSSTQIIRTRDFEKYVSVELGFTERLPFRIVESDNPQKIELYVYCVTSDIDWVFYDRKSEFIKEIKHSQPIDGVLKVEIFLNQKTHWGYKPVYDGNILKLSINKPARRNAGFLFWSNQLKGRVISIDPGHTSDFGAVGPRGTKEKDVNFEISLKLKELLENSGAVVYFTHRKDEDLPLRDRKQRVNSFNPEISVSMHNNAVPQGVDPIVHNGSSVYYYYPQSLPLAKLVYKNLLNKLGLKDFGLYWDNLYMCRIPESISFLLEPAFMIVPEQERLLKTDEFQYKIAESVYEALESFYKEYSE